MEVDLASVDSVAADEPAAAPPVEEAVQEPAGESEAPVGAQVAPEDDAGTEARVNGGSAEDTIAEPETPLPEEPATVPEENEEALEPKSPRGVKRRASRALSSDAEEFHGFGADESKLDDSTQLYTSLVDTMAAEVAADEATLKPVRRVAAPRVLKRLRTEDRSRSSSSLSHRSDGEALSTDMGASSPASGRGRRTAPDALSSPQYRVPFERGWKRELVYRAAIDPHQRRNADIYYYTPAGKKLRSTREVADHISGSGLTLDNFTFFKEPIGLDDPEKEIIRDAKHRDSPQASPAPAVHVEGKRTPKPKQPKGASPEYRGSSTPLKIKVKSQGSRLSGSGRASTGDKASTPTSNTSWKKPRLLVPPPPPLLCRPAAPQPQRNDQGEPCSMRCPGAPGQVPSLACIVCLCLYHPKCAGHTAEAANFLCKNCRANSGPPPLTHKTGSPTPPPPPLTPAPGAAMLRPPSGVSQPPPVRRYPVPVPVAIRRVVVPSQRMQQRPLPPVAPTPAAAPPRVYLRMKAQGGSGERVWAVQPTPGASPPPALTPAPVRPTVQTVRTTAPIRTTAPTVRPTVSTVRPTVSTVRPTVSTVRPTVSTVRPTGSTVRPTVGTQNPRTSVPQTVAIINGRKFIVVPKQQAAAYTQ